MDGQEDLSLSQWCTEVDRLRAGERERRQRAPRACQKCRSRKVRCDVAIVGTPCFHCKLDGVVCKIASTKRGSSCKTNTSIKHPASGPQSSARSATSCRGGARNTSVTLKGSEQERPLVQIADPDTDSLQACKHAADRATHTEESPIVFLDAQGANIDLKNCIRPPPPHLTSEDCNYIRLKRCMELFELELRQTLLEAYIQYVFPILPVLDIQTVSSTILADPEQRQPIGLCLLQSIYLLGALYAPAHSLRLHKFSSRSEALSTIYSRVKLLTDMNYQHDAIESFQVALHMILYFRDSQETLMEQKWLTTAIGLDTLMISNQQVPSCNDISATAALRRRLEWALYILQERAPPSLLQHGIFMRGRSNIPAVTREDFDFSSLGDAYRKILFGNTLAPIDEIEQQFATSCNSFASLRSITFNVYAHDHILFKECQNTKSDQARVSMLAAEYCGAGKQLHEWMRIMPPDFRAGPRHICPKQRSNSSTMQRVQFAVMYVTWYNLCKELERRMAKLTVVADCSHSEHLNCFLRRLRGDLDAAGSILGQVVLQRHRLSQLNCTDCRTIFQSLKASSMERRLFMETSIRPQPSLFEPAEAYTRAPTLMSSCQGDFLDKPHLSPVSHCTSMRDWLAAVPTPESVTDDFGSAQKNLPHFDHIVIPATRAASEQDSDPEAPSPDFEQYLNISQIEGLDFELFQESSTISGPSGLVSVC